MKEDLRVIKTRESIEYALVAFLKKYSFEEISVKMIVELSRINRSTFYRNYEDKYDLLNGIVERLLKEMQASADAHFISLHYNNAAQYHPMLKPLIEFFSKNKNILITLWNATLPINFYDEMINLFSRLLFDAMKETYEIQKDKVLLAQLYTELFATHTTTTIRWWLTNETSLSINEIIEIMTNNIEKGFFLSMENTFK